MFNSSIDKIEKGMTVRYLNELWTVKENTGEEVSLESINFNKVRKVLFYNCNHIQNEEGAYF